MSLPHNVPMDSEMASGNLHSINSRNQEIGIVKMNTTNNIHKLKSTGQLDIYDASNSDGDWMKIENSLNSAITPNKYEGIDNSIGGAGIMSDIKESNRIDETIDYYPRMNSIDDKSEVNENIMIENDLKKSKDVNNLDNYSYFVQNEILPTNDMKEVNDATWRVEEDCVKIFDGNNANDNDIMLSNDNDIMLSNDKCSKLVQHDNPTDNFLNEHQYKYNKTKMLNTIENNKVTENIIISGLQSLFNNITKYDKNDSREVYDNLTSMKYYINDNKRHSVVTIKDIIDGKQYILSNNISGNNKENIISHENTNTNISEHNIYSKNTRRISWKKIGHNNLHDNSTSNNNVTNNKRDVSRKGTMINPHNKSNRTRKKRWRNHVKKRSGRRFVFVSQNNVRGNTRWKTRKKSWN